MSCPHRTPARALLALAAALGLLALPDTADAAGFWLPARGVGPLGRGGAAVALDDDLNALWYNPGGLGTLDAGHHLLFDGSLVNLSFSFTRQPTTARSGDPVTYETVDNEAAPLVIPQLLYATRPWTAPITLAAGFYAPYAAPYRFEEWGPQRYALIDNTRSLIAYAHLAVAWQLHERVSIGVGLQNVMAAIDASLMGSTYIGLWGEPEDRDLDALFNLSASDWFTLSGNAGVWAEPIDGLHLGFSVQLPAEIRDDDARVKVRLPSHYAFDEARVEGDTLALALSLPWIVRGGVRYVLDGLFDLEVDVTWERWSSLERIRTTPEQVRVTGVPVAGELVVGPLDLERRMQDTLSVHVGGDWHPLPDTLTVRAGFFFEQGAIPDETYSVFQADSDKYAPTLGASLHLGRWSIDAAYSHVFQSSRQVRDSVITQINPAYEQGAVVVGNGDYDSSYDIFGLGGRVAF